MTKDLHSIAVSAYLSLMLSAAIVAPRAHLSLAAMGGDDLSQRITGAVERSGWAATDANLPAAPSARPASLRFVTQEQDPIQEIVEETLSRGRDLEAGAVAQAMGFTCDGKSDKCPMKQIGLSVEERPDDMRSSNVFRKVDFSVGKKETIIVLSLTNKGEGQRFYFLTGDDGVLRKVLLVNNGVRSFPEPSRYENVYRGEVQSWTQHIESRKQVAKVGS